MNTLDHHEKSKWHRNGPKNAPFATFQTFEDNGAVALVDALRRESQDFRYARARKGKRQAEGANLAPFGAGRARESPPFSGDKIFSVAGLIEQRLRHGVCPRFSVGKKRGRAIDAGKKA
jgi:hypothetical protein